MHINSKILNFDPFVRLHDSPTCLLSTTLALPATMKGILLLLVALGCIQVAVQAQERAKGYNYMSQVLEIRKRHKDRSKDSSDSNSGKMKRKKRGMKKRRKTPSPTPSPTVFDSTFFPTDTFSPSPTPSSKRSMGSKKGSKSAKSPKSSKTIQISTLAPTSLVAAPVASPTAPTVPVATPVAVPVATPVDVPVATPVAPPVTPTVTRSCTSSFGTCASSQAELAAQLSAASDSATIALCPGLIATITALQMTHDNGYLCCESGICIVSGLGMDRNLIVTGANSRIEGITFVNGDANGGLGGNVAITGSGVHRIVDSIFRNGEAENGGNLGIESNNSQVVIERSSFQGGDASERGGSVYIEGAVDVLVNTVEFSENTASEGGALYSSLGTSLSGVSQTLSITASSFTDNEAILAGGVYVENLGSSPSMSITLTTFNNNSAESIGGAGAIVEFLEDIDLALSGNTGSGNTANICNDFVSFQQTSQEPVCIGASDSLP